MTDELTPDPEAMQRMVDQDQATAALRSLADSVVLIRKTLIDGGFPEESATAMAMRAWQQFFPGQPPAGPLGFLFGGGPPPA